MTTKPDTIREKYVLGARHEGARHAPGAPPSKAWSELRLEDLAPALRGLDAGEDRLALLETFARYGPLLAAGYTLGEAVALVEGEA